MGHTISFLKHTSVVGSVIPEDNDTWKEKRIKLSNDLWSILSEKGLQKKGAHARKIDTFCLRDDGKAETIWTQVAREVFRDDNQEPTIPEILLPDKFPENEAVQHVKTRRRKNGDTFHYTYFWRIIVGSMFDVTCFTTEDNAPEWADNDATIKAMREMRAFEMLYHARRKSFSTAPRLIGNNKPSVP